MNIPRIMIAGTHSGVGKTTITTAILSLLTRSGYNVQPFKIGPDYIDPSYHTLATGNVSRNLDSWMLEEATVRRLFYDSASIADIAVIEGVMGVFDGSAGNADTGSSAHIAKLLDCPVILIVDVKSMARSAAAVVSGFKNFDPQLNVAGIILNRIGSERHLNLVCDAIETYCDIPVIGYFKKNTKLELPSRHLGLVPTVEGGALAATVSSLPDEIAEGINIEKLVQVAKSAVTLNTPPSLKDIFLNASEPVRIGIASDEAFSFYYEDGLDILKRGGAELIPFSPLHDHSLPDNLYGLYIGGGFPEMFIEQLSSNKQLLGEIKKAGDAGMPVFGECGGLMYLSRYITDFNGKCFSMTGLVPGGCIMQNRLVGMGYVEASAVQDNIITNAGEKIRGHEFHYSRFQPDTVSEEHHYAFRLVRNRSRETVYDGFAHENILASYLHLHFCSNPELAKNFINKCRLYKKKQESKQLSD